jgi:fructose-bisphosphate aldolase class II
VRRGRRSSSRSEIGVVGGEEDGVANEINEQLYTTPEDAIATVEALGAGEKRPLHDRADLRQRARRLQARQRQAAPEILKTRRRPRRELGLAGRPPPFDLVFHGGSGSTAEEISAAVDFGVVKMNVDTDTQYAFTRPSPRTCSPTTTAC